MAAVSLQTLELRARNRADMTGDSFVTADLNSIWGWIQEGAQKLHDLLVEKIGDDYFVNTSTFNTVANQSAYSLPADFYKLLAIDLYINGNGYPVDMKKFTLKERNAFRLAANQVYGAALPRYRIVGNQLYVFPAPPGSYQVQLWYAPLLQVAIHGGGTTANVFANSDDTVNFPNGWERYIVAFAARMALMKEESDVSELDRELVQVEHEIEIAAENRDPSAPESAVDLDKSDLDPRVALTLY